MLLKDTFFDSEHEYVAQLENGSFVMGYSYGTVIGMDGRLLIE